MPPLGRLEEVSILILLEIRLWLPPFGRLGVTSIPIFRNFGLDRGVASNLRALKPTELYKGFND